MSAGPGPAQLESCQMVRGLDGSRPQALTGPPGARTGTAGR